MSSQSDFYRDILDNLSDGAMAVNFQGEITLFNPAAARIFEIEAERVLGRKFAEVFMLEIEGSDDFNQVFLDAIYEEKIDAQRKVEIRKGDQPGLVLKVKSSLLRSRSGEKLGVVVVFTDVSREDKLQREQEQLNKDLQQAYLDLEDSNSELRSALKKVKAVRLAILLGVLVAVLVLGYYLWGKTDFMRFLGPDAPQNSQEAGVRTEPVQVRPVTSSISLSGKLRPLKKVNFICPYDGRVQEVYVDFGQRVQRGETLLRLGSERLEEDYRDARANLIEARQAYERLKNWEQGSEYHKAGRSLSKAEYQREKAQSELEESKVLFDNGIISENELQRAKDKVRNAKISLVEARENMVAVKAKASPEKLKVARFKLENARSKLERIQDRLNSSEVKASVSGVVLRPVLQRDQEYNLEKGSAFKEGDILISIGDMRGLSIDSLVDEVDVQKLEQGQEVVVKGEGFSEVSFQGFIDQVSTVAKDSRNSDLTLFPVRVVIPSLDQEQRRQIRLGMTANMQVEIYSNPEALLVPIQAVSSSPKGHFVRCKQGPRQGIKEVPVETGLTTMEMVEIKSGLRPGDQVVVP